MSITSPVSPKNIDPLLSNIILYPFNECKAKPVEPILILSVVSGIIVFIKTPFESITLIELGPVGPVAKGIRLRTL